MKNNINFPGFINDSSVIEANGYFKTSSNHLIIPKIKHSVYPAVQEQEVEYIDVFGSHPCGAGDIQLGEGENTVCINPDTIWSDPPTNPQPPGGGGGGGGGGPYSDGPGMERTCKGANIKAGCTAGMPSPMHRCETLLCQTKYCEDYTCSPTEQRAADNASTEINNTDVCEIRCKDFKRDRSSFFNQNFLQAI